MQHKLAPCLCDAVTLWKQHFFVTGRSERTIASFSGEITRAFEFMATLYGRPITLQSVDKLTLHDWYTWQRWRQKLGYHPKSQYGAQSALRRFYAFLGSHYGIEYTLLLRLGRINTPQRLPRDIAYDDIMHTIEALQDTAPNAWQADRDTALVMPMYGCGLRITEARTLSLAQSHHAIRHGWLRVTGKGRKQRDVPVLSDCFKSSL